MNLCP